MKNKRKKKEQASQSKGEEDRRWRSKWEKQSKGARKLERKPPGEGREGVAADEEAAGVEVGGC